MKNLITICIFLIGISSTFCQSDISKIKGSVKSERISETLELRQQKEDNYKLALEKAKTLGIDTINIEGINNLGEIQYVSQNNTTGAATTNTHTLHQNGGLGLNLEGAGFFMGIWEADDADGANLPRATHENLNSIFSGLNSDTGSGISDHATHVAGTLAGNGSGNSSAKGMAPQANLLAFDLGNNLNEMDIRASLGMLVSNHSYGSRSGWTIDEDTENWQWSGGWSTFIAGGEDVEFGLYDDEAVLWDWHCVIHPNSLVVKAAGNDRNDNPQFGTTVLNPSGNPVIYNASLHPLGDGWFDNSGYNTIPTYGNAKNILTVGAINGAAGNTMSTFSGWGPTDDGRIKPDIVGHGVGVLSSIGSGNGDYDNFNGTSMAAPNVAGSALLLQEHYENVNGSGNFMRSATLKGLIVHTAEDLDNVGPDYKVGWGLMDAEAAVKIINEDDDSDTATSIIETTYSGTTQQYGFISNCIYGSNVAATLTYTDEAGDAKDSEDSTPDLVNDLDMSFRNNFPGFEKLPYVLNPQNPTAPAQTGDNDLDNVERIDFRYPNGVEVAKITHEGTLRRGEQDYSLIISGSGLDQSCLVVENQSNIYIGDGAYCFDDVMETRAIINSGRETEHVSPRAIKLLPGAHIKSGSKSLFRINQCIYVN